MVIGIKKTIDKLKALHKVLASWERVSFEVDVDIAVVKRVFKINRVSEYVKDKIDKAYENVVVNGEILYGLPTNLRNSRKEE